jgi:hypothetical protein
LDWYGLLWSGLALWLFGNGVVLDVDIGLDAVSWVWFVVVS